MKRNTFKRIMSLLLCLLLVGSALSVVIPVSAASEVSVQNGTGTREPIRVGESFSYRAIVNGSFTGFAFSMPTWEKKTSYCTVSLYKWEGSFNSTVSKTPLATKDFNPMVDGNYHWVEFDAQPAGEYLFHVSGVSADVGVWTNTGPSNPKGFLYINGIEQRGEPQMIIRFTDAVDEPFGNCEASADINNPQIPFTSGKNEQVTNFTESMGVRLNLNEAFSGIQFKMATYMATDIVINISVYEWKGNYEDTRKASPVATDSFTMIDNAWQGIRFDKLPAGDYLILAHDPTGAPAMYGFSEVEGFEGYIYHDGYIVSNITLYPEIQVVFAADREDNTYYLPCSEPGDVIDGNHTTPPAYVIPEDSLINTHPVMPDTWVFTDGLGRVSLTNADVGDLKDDKTLAMFYWTWHTDGFVIPEAVNIQKISEQYPDAMRDWDNPLWDTLGTAYQWNESIYGFYRTTDPWVLRKQAELLTNAGVDVIFTDNTNGTSTWRSSYTVLMDTWTEAMNDGLKTPKVSFMLPFWDKDYTNAQLQSLYLDIYRPGKWDNLWFYWEDKPMLMAIQESVKANNSNIEKEIANYFTFRAGQPDYLFHPEKREHGSWGWLSMYPQATYAGSRENVKSGKIEQITVGIAMNHDYENKALAAMSGNHIAGRSYTSTYPDRFEKEGAEASKWGYNFAEQWEYALEVDPQVVFVTGWNEFRVGRYETWPEGSVAAVENAFPDQYNDEFSRDIEPTKGELKDHYYYQLVNYVRKFKGARAIPTPSVSTTIDLNAGEDQWKNVEPYYAAYIGNTDDRNCQGYGSLVYTETSGRNDIIGAQVARDDEFVYFHVECAENITPYTDNLWMTLYIDTDQQNQGWETFEYVINKSAASADTVVLEKFIGEGYNSEKVADCAYKVDGRYMTVKVAKSDLGLSGNDYTINFSWTDNVHDEGDETKFSGDIMDFYISGDVAPGARFKYSYISTAANAKGEDEQETTQDTVADGTEETTVSESAPVTEAPTASESETQSEDKGCASIAASASAVIMTAAAAAVVLKKREDNK